MSSKIPKKLSPGDDSSGNEPRADTPFERPGGESSASGLGEADGRTETPLDDNGDAEEFSLDKLSQAYARVLKGTPAAFNSVAGTQQPDTDLDSDGETEHLQAATAFSNIHEPTESATAADDNAACPITPESIVESMLFVGTPPGVQLTSRMIAAVIRDVSPKEISKIVKHLNERYAAEHAAYRIKTIDGGLKLELEESLLSFQQQFFGRNKSVKLSQAAVEVLAVVAYNQPLTRDQLDKLRGKPSGGILSQLVRRELLTLFVSDNKSDAQQFVTTEKFLDFFHLAELTDLPQSHEVSDFDELAD